VYAYTLEAVKTLFDMGCPLVIIACNTSSAKALRTIQQKDLPRLDPSKRVLGVIRPTVEAVNKFTATGHIGILGTPGTVNSESYIIEIKKLYPDLVASQEACPLWVPLVENMECNNQGAHYFVSKNIHSLLSKDGRIDTIILGCTHYPLLLELIRKVVPQNISVVPQDEIVAQSLSDYLHRHPEMDDRITRAARCRFYTTETAELFQERASLFFGKPIQAEHTPLISALPSVERGKKV